MYLTSTQKVSSTSRSVEFEYLIAREGEPSVVFLNGYRMHFKSWGKVYKAIAAQNSVFLYNRLGIGKSSKPHEPQNGLTVVENVHKLLAAVDVKPPYVLVAHSMGGLMAELYARTFQEEVVGIVFVDCPHPDEIAEMKKFKMPLILEGLNFVLSAIDKLLSRYVHSEDENIEKTVSEIKQAGDFPEIPIVIISGQKKMPFVPVPAFNMHQSYQRKILELSPYSSQIECYKSGHFPQISEPNRVISSINDILFRFTSANKLSQQDAQKARSSA